MSRNLCRTDCDRCSGPVNLEEAPRLITREEAGRYFPEYRSMSVANAYCIECGARYLAWVSNIPHRQPDPSKPFHDLSYRSTFNDEALPEDLPAYNPVETLARFLYETAPIVAVPTTPWVNLASYVQVGYRESASKLIERYVLRRRGLADPLPEGLHPVGTGSAATPDPDYTADTGPDDVGTIGAAYGSPAMLDALYPDAYEIHVPEQSAGRTRMQTLRALNEAGRKGFGWGLWEAKKALEAIPGKIHEVRSLPEAKNLISALVFAGVENPRIEPRW